MILVINETAEYEIQKLKIKRKAKTEKSKLHHDV